MLLATGKKPADQNTRPIPAAIFEWHRSATGSGSSSLFTTIRL
jgi:hypothetical protein